MQRYKLFATRLGLRGISALFSFMRILVVFSFGASALTTLVVDKAHLVSAIDLSNAWQENQAIIFTSLILAIGADMTLNWLKNQVIISKPRIVNLMDKFSLAKPKIVELNINELQN